VSDESWLRSRRRLRWLSAVAVLAALLVPVLGLVAASRVDPPVVVSPVTAPPAVRLTPDGTATSPVSWQVRSTGDRAVDDVVLAYRRYLGTTVRLAENPDPNDPALPHIATGARLDALQRFLIAAHNTGSTTRGPVTASARVLETAPTEVTLRACTDYTRQRTTTSTARPLTAGKVASTVILRREASAWRVATSARATWSSC
jgi:hypothetical protein